MTTDTTTPTETRALYGCPSWCTSDHRGPQAPEAGEHSRALAKAATSSVRGPADVSVEVAPWRPDPTVIVWLGGNQVEAFNLPTTRETVEELRDVALMFKAAADELAGLLQSGELEARA